MSVEFPTVIFNFPQYLSAQTADSYFYSRLNSDVWLQSTEQEKNAALIQSTRAIDNLNFVGTKVDMAQPCQFPRVQPPPYATSALPPWLWGGYYYDNQEPFTPITPPKVIPGIPQEILIACCENAITLLDGFDIELELKSLYVTSDVYAGVRTTYDRNIAVTHLVAGIASSVAWKYLTPWLADAKSFIFSRAN